MSQLKWARRAAGIAVVVAALLVIGAGSATTTSSSTIYVSYTACQFTISTDSQSSVTSGSSIPYGSYQVEVSTQGSYSGTPVSCNGQTVDQIGFQLTGPGVDATTSLQMGDASSQTLGPYTFAANSSYTATDTVVPGPTTITFQTNGTAVSAPTGSSGTTSTTSSGGCSVLGGSSGCSSGSTTKVTKRGSLAGGVSPAGKVSLVFKGKTVSTLLAGDYTLTVNDKSHKAGFVLKGHGTDTITTAAFVGKTVTVDLTTGQWSFAPKSGGTKTYFYVES